MDRRAKIIGLLLQSVNLFNEIEKQPKSYGTDELLYNSEIDTLMVIGTAGSINLTGIARDLEISKSGTSRFVKKLLDKKMIWKGKKEGNDKEVIFSLTSKGKVAFEHKEHLNRELYCALYGNIKNYVEDDLNRIESFLKETNEEMSKFL